MRNAIRFVVLISIAVALSCSSDDPTVPETASGPDSSVTTWAGNGRGGFVQDGLHRLDSRLNEPIDIEFTPTLGTFITDWQNHRIRQVMADGTLETIVGRSQFGDGPEEPNLGRDLIEPWPGKECLLNHPTKVFERDDGMLVIVAWHNHKLREYDPVTQKEFVFTGAEAGCIDGPNERDSRWNQLSHALQAQDGSIYVLDQRNQCVRKISYSGGTSTVTAIVAQAVCDQNNPGGFSGDGGPPTDAQVSFPSGGNPLPGGGIAMDEQGRLYIADTNNQRIRRIDFVANTIVTVVGNGTAGYGGDGGDPLDAMLNIPRDIEFGPHGRLYIADSFNNCVRVVDFEKNTINTIAGTGARGYSGDGGPATEATFYEPRGIAFDKSGDLYVVDTENHVIRRVDLN